ncbi:ROK family protein [Streptomyces sp. Q6]|uniref:ROK family protein n=1 Tax=Streptomyces citrinus TaxID=3118173 RepID=A0ACD5ASY5_9ACTN
MRGTGTRRGRGVGTRAGRTVPGPRSAGRRRRRAHRRRAGARPARRGGAALGEALAGVVSALDPDVVVVAGGVLDSGPWYLDALRAELSAHTLPLLREVPVRPAVLGADAVALGVAVHALRRPVPPPVPGDVTPAHA